MSNWVDDFGFSAVDEAAFKAKQTPEVQPISEDVEGLSDNVLRIEQKIDALLRNFGDQEEALEQRKEFVDALADKKVKAMSEVILPLLNSLLRTKDQEYIHWPNRGEIISEQVTKVNSIIDGSFFKEGD